MVEEDESCVKVIGDTKIQLTPPASSRAYTSGKETQYSFKGIFGEESSQSDVFQQAGLPLVEDLTRGHNGLLFTYGVTGSGKTHTMQGSLQDGGVMNRVIDVLFNSIRDNQTKKFRLVPDRLNGFDIVEDVDAAQIRQTEMINNMRSSSRNRRTANDPGLANRVPETHKLTVDEDAQYAVFISYVEVYNNYIYDLLETPQLDIVSGKPKLLSKTLREDSFRNMYVNGVTEQEVKTPEEALETFLKGQKQRKVAQTMLNLSSSRSHSIFNIRLCQVPFDPVGEDIMKDPTVMTVSQLALVDLAGSERTARTGNTGDRLAEASKINQSLMTLRSCIETLRENQQSGGSKMVPYRDSRVTHLFRNYFEGEGKVKMIVCVNPRASDFDENVNVMKFSELTQEVQIERPQAVKPSLGLTPGRRRGNQIFKEAMRRIESEGNLQQDMDDLTPLYSLGPDWPILELQQFDEEEVVERLKSFLEKRIATRKSLKQDHTGKTGEFRDLLLKREDELVLLRSDNKALKSQLEAEKKRIRQLESRLTNAESANRSLNDKVGKYEDMRMIFENELDEKELMLNNEQKERIKTRLKYKNKLANEKEKISDELGKRFEMQRKRDKEKQAKMIEKLNELNQLAFVDNNTANIENVPNRNNSDPNLSRCRDRGRTPMKASTSDPRISMTPVARRSIAVSNARHRRSRSANADTWLDHRPIQGTVPLDTVLQPILKRKKSVSRLEEKDVVNSKTNKYVLTTQQQLDEGDMETRLFKGDVIPTVSGGRQVVFNDVEVLTQESPDRSGSPRKRSYEEFRGISARIADLQERCGTGIEGHPVTPAITRSRNSKRSKV